MLVSSAKGFSPGDLASWLNWLWYTPGWLLTTLRWSLTGPWPKNWIYPLDSYRLSPPEHPLSMLPQIRTSLGNPALLEEVLIRHPKLRVYLMHAGFPYLQETKAIHAHVPAGLRGL